MTEQKPIPQFSYFFFIVNELDAFYEMKILDIAANRPAQYLKKKYILTDAQKKNFKYKKLDGYKNIFEIDNSGSNTLCRFRCGNMFLSKG